MPKSPTAREFSGNLATMLRSLSTTVLVCALPLCAQVEQEKAVAPFAADVVLLGSESDTKRKAAEARLHRAGRRAMDAMRQVLRSGNRRSKLALVRFLRKCGALGRVLVPELLRLARVDPGPKPKISLVVKSGPKGLRIESLFTLSHLAPFADTEPREEIRSLLASEMENRHGFHVKSIRRGYFRSGVGERTADLVEQLTDANPFVREAAAERLGFAGDAAPTVLAGLHAAFETEDHPSAVKVRLRGLSGSSGDSISEEIRLAAARALIKLAKGGEQAEVAALFLVRKESPGPRLLQAVRLVGRLGEGGRSGLARLLALTAEEDARIAAEAVTAIGMIGVLDEDVSSVLKKAAARAEKSVAVRAAATLKMLQRGRKKNGKMMP